MGKTGKGCIRTKKDTRKLENNIQIYYPSH